MSSKKQPNLNIGCNVRSCAYHFERDDYCSLPGIVVEPRPNHGSGEASDESMCGSYDHK